MVGFEPKAPLPMCRTPPCGIEHVLGAHYLSGFVTHSLSGSEPSPRRVDEPGSDAARSADGSV